MTRDNQNKKIFYKWLEENIDRFHHKPIKNADGSFYFVGITKAIRLFVDFAQPEAMLLFDDMQTKENYEIYTINYIGKYRYNAKYGHYDADRIDKIYTYYSSYEELIVTEVFEPIIEYCNKHFQKNNALYLVKAPNYTEGFITLKDEKAESPFPYSRKLHYIKMKNIAFKKVDIVTKESLQNG